MCTAKIQISLRINEVWADSGYWTYFGQPRMYNFSMRINKTLIGLHGCAGWFESSFGAHVRRYVFVVAQFKSGSSVFDIFRVGFLAQPWCWRLFYGPQHVKTYLLTCAPNEGSNQPAHPHSLISLHYPLEKTFHPCLSEMWPVKILIKLRECAEWLNLRWAHISKGSFATDILRWWLFYNYTTII